MSNVAGKFKDILFSVLPIVIIFFVLNFSIVHLSKIQIGIFLIGSVFIILGLTIFLIGVDLSIDDIGSRMGETIAKKNKIIYVILFGLIIGLLITIAEPNLHIMASEYNFITGGLLSQRVIVIAVSFGVAVFVLLGILRILYNIKLKWVILAGYGLILFLSFFSSKEFIAAAFDSSAASTGSVVTPFIMALAFGISSMKKSSSEEDSFGLLGIVAIGAIASVLALGAFNKKMVFNDQVFHITEQISLLHPFSNIALRIFIEVLISVVPISILYLLFNAFAFKLPRKHFIKIIMGLIYTTIGLFVFMLGVKGGLLETGKLLGQAIGKLKAIWIILIGSAIGLFVVLSEPSVHVLTRKIEVISAGYIKRPIVLLALCIGAALSLFLSMLRIVINGLELWHILLPCYLLAVGLSFIAPDIFVGIAFDAGGVASGPMAATFVVALAQGVASSWEGASILLDGFGVLSLIALSPLITLQIVGIIFKFREKKVKYG